MILSSLRPGESATVLDIARGADKRLRDIGLIKGTGIKCLQKAPSGDPVAYLIRGAVIALRHEDSSGVTITPYDEVNLE